VKAEYRAWCYTAGAEFVDVEIKIGWTVETLDDYVLGALSRQSMRRKKACLLVALFPISSLFAEGKESPAFFGRKRLAIGPWRMTGQESTLLCFKGFRSKHL
jgi:hypothetical protein